MENSFKKSQRRDNSASTGNGDVVQKKRDSLFFVVNFANFVWHCPTTASFSPALEVFSKLCLSTSKMERNEQ